MNLTIEHEAAISRLTLDVADISWDWKTWLRLSAAPSRSNDHDVRRLHAVAPLDLGYLQRLLQDHMVLAICRLLEDRRRFGFRHVIEMIDRPQNTHPIKAARPLFVRLEERSRKLEAHRNERVAHRSQVLESQPPPPLLVNDFQECVTDTEVLCNRIRSECGMNPVQFEVWSGNQPGEQLANALSQAADWNELRAEYLTISKDELAGWLHQRFSSQASVPPIS